MGVERLPRQVRQLRIEHRGRIWAVSRCGGAQGGGARTSSLCAQRPSSCRCSSAAASGAGAGWPLTSVAHFRRAPRKPEGSTATGATPRSFSTCTNGISEGRRKRRACPLRPALRAARAGRVSGPPALEGRALRACDAPRRPPHSVDVFADLGRRVVLHDPVHVGQVQPPRCNVLWGRCERERTAERAQAGRVALGGRTVQRSTALGACANFFITACRSVCVTFPCRRSTGTGSSGSVCPPCGFALGPFVAALGGASPPALALACATAAAAAARFMLRADAGMPVPLLAPGR